MQLLKKLKYIIIVLSILVVALYLYIAFSMIGDKIPKNVYINNVDVSLLTKEEAIEKVNSNVKLQELTLQYGKNKFSKDFDKINFRYDVEKGVEEAFAVAKDTDFFKNILTIIQLNMGDRRDIRLGYEYDEKKLDKFITDISKKLNSNPKEATITASKGKVKVTAGKDGKIVQKQKLLEDINSAIESATTPFVDVNISFITKSPKLKYADLKQINGLIASYQTRYSTADYGRSHNIENAAAILDKKIIMPGEEVSFLKSLGDINWYNGFMRATIIVNNEYVQGMGGGVCQVSTTLYNALLQGGVEIKERKNHSLAVHYAPLGRDATVATGSTDLKYKNSYDFPIYIRNYASNGVMRSEIYGDTTKVKKIELYTSYHKGAVVTYKIQDGKKTIISSDWYTRY